MPATLDSDISLLIRDDSKMEVLLVSAISFLVLLAAVVIVYIYIEARRIARQDISQWRRPVPREISPESSLGEHSVWFQENQLKNYIQKHSPVRNTLQPNTNSVHV